MSHAYSSPRVQIVRDEDARYMASGRSALGKIKELQAAAAPRVTAPAPALRGPRLGQQMEQALAQSFPGTEHDMPDAAHFRLLGARGPAVPRFNTDPIEPGRKLKLGSPSLSQKF